MPEKVYYVRPSGKATVDFTTIGYLFREKWKNAYLKWGFFRSSCVGQDCSLLHILPFFLIFVLTSKCSYIRSKKIAVACSSFMRCDLKKCLLILDVIWSSSTKISIDKKVYHCNWMERILKFWSAWQFCPLEVSRKLKWLSKSNFWLSWNGKLDANFI